MSTNAIGHLRVGGLVAYYVSSIVGVGILIVPSIAAKIAGPASLLAWAALVLVSYPFASVFAYTSTRFPDSAGVTKAIEHGFGTALGRTMAILLACTMLIGNPVMGIATARYIQHMTALPDGSALLLIGNAMMVLSVLFNLAGLRIGSRITSWMLIALISGIVVMIASNVPFMSAHRFQPFAPHGWLAVGSAALVCFFCFLGWENVSTIAEEVVEPETTFRRAIPIAITVVGAIYLSLSLAYISASDPSATTGTDTVVSALLRPAFGARSAAFGDFAAVILLVLATNVWVAGASRLVYALARDGILPSFLSIRSARTNVPVNALIALAIGYSLITVLLLATHSNERALITITNSNFLLVYLCVFLAAMRSFHGRIIRLQAAAAFVTTLAFLPFCGGSLVYSLIAVTASHLLYRYISSRPRKDVQKCMSAS